MPRFASLVLGLAATRSRLTAHSHPSTRAKEHGCQGSRVWYLVLHPSDDVDQPLGYHAKPATRFPQLSLRETLCTQM